MKKKSLYKKYYQYQKPYQYILSNEKKSLYKKLLNSTCNIRIYKYRISSKKKKRKLKMEGRRVALNDEYDVLH